MSKSRRMHMDLSEKEKMPIFDESIFDPDLVLRQLGFTTDDIADLAAFMRWHIEQREKQRKGK